jgi:type IV pilus assembly protein PilM
MSILTNKFNTFGLDIGDRSLKAVHVQKYGTQAKIKSFGMVSVPTGVFDKGSLIKPAVFCEHINKLLASVAPKKIGTRYVHACLPETHTFIKLLSLDSAAEEELAARIRDELPRHIPLDVDESYIDWIVLPKTAATQQKQEVLVGAIPKKTSDSYTQSLRSCGLSPVSLQIEAQAIARALLPNTSNPEPIALVDIGATRSSFIVVHRNTIEFTISIPISSEAITRIISERFRLSMQDAEKAKLKLGLSPSPSKEGATLVETLQPVVEKLGLAIQKNIAYFSEHFSQPKPISTVLLCGGGAMLSGLAESLSANMPHVDIKQGDPLLHIKNRNTELNLSYTTALGLALTNAL